MRPLSIALPRPLFATVLVAAFLVSVAACNDEAPFEAGEAEAGNAPYTFTVLETRGCPLPEGVNEKEQRIFGVHVRLEGHHEGGVPANYFYASVLTQDGARYLAELSGCEPVMSGPPLYPGETAVGFFNFPLPLSKTPKTLEYAPLMDSGDSVAQRSEIPLP